MKNKIMKVVNVFSLFMLTLVTKVNATAWQTGDMSGNVSGDEATIIAKIAGFMKPIAAIVIFGSVLMIGFEIIMKRNKADDRMASMSSLMWVGIGAMVIAFAALIASFLLDGVGAAV